MIKTNMCISKNILPFGKAWLGCLLSLFMAGCSGDDLEQHAQRADNANEIGFMSRTETVTRADYKPDNPHPATMGVFGYHDLSENTIEKPDNIIFGNTIVSYEKKGEEKAWKYAPIKYWPEYSAFSDFDFFGYMPYNENATLTYYDGDYILSFDVDLSSKDMTEGKNIPLVCNKPHHKNYPGDIVNFDMDQVLTGFQLMFKLGTKMSKVRQFEITKVVVFGDIPYKGRFSRTYKYSDKSWTPKKMDWSIDEENDIKPLSLDIANNGGSLTLKDDEFHEWGSPFFAIPVNYFKPTISVTYNVRVVVDGKETRHTVTNNIVFNEANFADLKTSFLKDNAGKISSLKIAIVPDHLYVLADADQYIGTLAIE